MPGATANILSLVNDSHAVRRPDCPAPAVRVDNCAFVELNLRGWPCVAVVTTVPITVGEELLTKCALRDACALDVHEADALMLRISHGQTSGTTSLTRRLG